MLDDVVAYIGRNLQAAGGRTEEHAYQVNGRTYRNVIASFGSEAGSRFIIGAHYNVCGEQPGADDNGTGVAALLETARLLGLPYRIELVAYPLE